MSCRIGIFYGVIVDMLACNKVTPSRGRRGQTQRMVLDLSPQETPGRPSIRMGSPCQPVAVFGRPADVQKGIMVPAERRSERDRSYGTLLLRTMTLDRADYSYGKLGIHTLNSTGQARAHVWPSARIR